MIITTVITEKQHKELKRLSYETDKSMAEIIRAAIDAMLERVEDENT
jgi:predicted DNA-binding protein